MLATVVFISNTMAQTFQIQITENDYGYLEVQMKETSGTGTPTTSTIVNDISFEIRWLTTLSTDVEIICTSNDYNLADALGSVQTEGSYKYRVFQAATTPLNPPENWTQNTWMTLATFKATSGSGSGSFQIAPDGWVAQGLNWNQGNPPDDYTPTVNGQADSYTYPTIVYDFVWTGGGTPTAFQNTGSWSLAGNWMDECGGSQGAAPTSSANCFIPTGLSNYPTNIYSGLLPNQTGSLNNLRIESGGSIDWGISATAPETLDIAGNLNIYGTLSISPDSYITADDESTYIDAATGLVVEADATGIGSFIDNGTITYGASGTAKVQTYLTNSSGSGNLDIHLIGPTVDQISGGTDGAYLSAFNLSAGNTYAYEWDETEATASGWQNISDNSYVVNTGAGIGLSANDNTNYTLNMTGELMTGSISSPSLTYSNNHNELISNPYPSAIDFDGLASDNSSVVENKYWIWNPAGNTYIARAAGSGGSQYIQVGQGFFVETKSGGGTFDFTNTRRAHSNDAFRSVTTNILTVIATGGQEGYEDEMIVRFDETATSGYDIEIEAEKWASQNSDATMIKTIAEDNTELAINVLPTESLNNGMTSVPMHFNCGYVTDYSLSFYDMESFETGTEIWLEDKQTGEDWISINNNPDYSFTATPDDEEDRFVLHFFGPTGVDEFGVENSIAIYGYRQHAFVKNNSNEVIKEVKIYTLAGELLREMQTVDLKLNKYWVSDKLGYYVVRVVTNNNVYTGKVFISK